MVIPYYRGGRVYSDRIFGGAEVLKIIRGVVKQLDIVGMDIVEVAPAYDGVGEVTALAAAQLVFEVMSGMVLAGPTKPVAKGAEAVKDEL